MILLLGLQYFTIITAKMYDADLFFCVTNPTKPDLNTFCTGYGVSLLFLC